MNKLVLILLAFYRTWISPGLAPRCRFYPSCSQYAQQAFVQLPFCKALGRVLARLGRCHPWHVGGFDPVLK